MPVIGCLSEGITLRGTPAKVGQAGAACWIEDDRGYNIMSIGQGGAVLCWRTNENLAALQLIVDGHAKPAGACPVCGHQPADNPGQEG